MANLGPRRLLLIHMRGRFKAPLQTETLIRPYYETTYTDPRIRTSSKAIEGAISHDRAADRIVQEKAAMGDGKTYGI